MAVWNHCLAALLTASLVLAACESKESKEAVRRAAGITPPELAQQAKALYDEKCRTVAGEKIYRTVPDVEGIVLLKVRPERTDKELADLMWPGAAFARESRGDEYITMFLGFENPIGRFNAPTPPISPTNRGAIGTKRDSGGLPGYRYIDIIDATDGKRYRVTGSHKAVRKQDTSAPNVQLAMKNDPNYDLNVYEWTLDKVPSPDPAPRYGVTFEDHVVPEERELGVASSTVKVIDLKTDEVLGEMTLYAWGSTLPSSYNPTPWLTSRICPVGPGTDVSATTRKFVDQILIPKKEQ